MHKKIKCIDVIQKNELLSFMEYILTNGIWLSGSLVYDVNKA